MNYQNYLIPLFMMGLTCLLVNYYKTTACNYAKLMHNLSTELSLNYSEFNAPIIGILTQSIDNSLREDEFVAASYVKFVESGGGRVIPIRFSMNDNELENIFHKINGLVITGGHQKLYKNLSNIDQISIRNGSHDQLDSQDIVEFTKYQKTVKWFLDRAEKAAAEEQDYFPIFAICLGHEALMLAAEPHFNSVQKLETNGTYHTSLPLVTKNAFDNPQSFWYGLPEHLKSIMQNERIFYYHHKYGTPKDWYDQSSSLKERFAPLTFALDNKNRTFITSFQHRALPIYAVQFHPEKNGFEWKSDSNRSPQALAISNYLANFFIDKCRQNKHKIDDKYELKSLIIYNYDQSRQSNIFSSIFVIPKDPAPIC